MKTRRWFYYVYLFLAGCFTISLISCGGGGGGIADNVMVVVDDTDSFNADAVQGPVVGSTNVLDNDFDPDALDEPLEVQDTTPQLLYLVDPDTNALTLIATGTITLDTDGSYTMELNEAYKAEAQALGNADSFKLGVVYTAVNQGGATDDALLRITINGTDKIVDTSAAAGFWHGTSTDQNNNTFTFGGIISMDGQLRFLIDEGDCFGTQFKGTFSMDGNAGSGTFTGYAGGICVFSNGETLINGTIDFTIAGDEMTGTFSSQEYSGTFSLVYDPAAENPITLADLTGDWIVEEGDFSEISVSANGSFTGIGGTGCNLSGHISIIDPDWAITDVSVTVSGCNDAYNNGVYTGLGLCQQFDKGRETFAVLVSSSASSAFGFFASLPDDNGGAGEPGPVNIIGAAETVFDWTTDRCEEEDIPDLPARAFRDNNGKVQLVATHFKNRRMIGDDLDSVEKDCNVIMDSDHDPDPAMYNDNEWINATYTPDGETVYALIHNEYQGAVHPGHCPSGNYMNCWYNSITMAVSHDSGATYTHVAAPGHLVASVPYQYVPDAGPYGIFEGSNIFYNAKDGYFYKMLHLEDYGLQKRGACVMRTLNLADPTSWRAWDGSDFNVQFINPYTEIGYDPADHVCEPASFDNIDKMADNITFNTFFNKFMLVGTASKWDPVKQAEVSGFFYSLSDDLVNWSERELIMECELWWTSDNSVDRLGYPTLIDPTDSSRNYINTAQSPYLYYTRWNKNSVYDRDLERIQIEFTK